VRRPAYLALLVFALCALPATAILDTNENGMSDVWELQFADGNLFPQDFGPKADPDGDGWTNEQEAVAGTDPFDATSTNGFVRPEVVIIHDVMLDLDHDEIPEFYTEVATISLPVIAGKQYTLLTSPSLTCWMQVEQSTAVSDETWTYNFPITYDESLFWRVMIEDVDSDGDGLTNAEEYAIGTNPNLVDTNGNGIPDNLDTNILTDSPQFTDADHDGIPDSYDSQPNTPRGAPPSIGLQTLSSAPVVNVMVGERLVLLVTVNNPAGPAVTAANLTLFVNGTQNGALISKVADNMFSIK